MLTRPFVSPAVHGSRPKSDTNIALISTSVLGLPLAPLWLVIWMMVR